MLPWIAAAAAPFIISGISNAISGNQQAEATRETNQANRDMTASTNAQNERLAREFAQNSIRWRVEDAKRAGLHPLAALGAAGSSGPVMQAGSDLPDYSGAEAVSNMGQNISRAISSTSTGHEREIQALTIANARLDLEGKALDNQYRLAQLNRLSSGPSFPGSDNFIPGQGDSPLMKVSASERTVSAPGRPAQQAGWVPDVAYARTDTGLTPVPSADVKERVEDQIVPETMWAIRNQLAPNFPGASEPPPRSMLPKGATHWSWNHFKQEWQPKSGHDVPDSKYGYKEVPFWAKWGWN